MKPYTYRCIVNKTCLEFIAIQHKKVYDLFEVLIYAANVNDTLRSSQTVIDQEKEREREREKESINE